MSERVYYHAAKRADLERITREGLGGRAHAGQRNFLIAPAHNDAVYLWSELGAAEAWAQRTHADPVILRVSEVDQNLIHADPEGVRDWLAHIGDLDAAGTQSPPPLAERVLDAINNFDERQGHAWANEVDHDWDGEEPQLASWDVVNHVPLEGMIEVIAGLDDPLRAELAEHTQKVERSGLMYMDHINPEQLEIAAVDLERARAVAGKDPVADPASWRAHLATDLRTSEFDEDGIGVAAHPRWRDLTDAQLSEIYSFHRIGVEQGRPQLTGLNDAAAAGAALPSHGPSRTAGR